MTPSDSSTLNALIDRQLAWAAAREIDLDEAGQARRADDNLFAPLCEPTLAELAEAPDRPLGDGDKPGRIHVLQSTEALACNFFDYWRSRTPSKLQAAIGACHEISELAFSVAQPSGVGDLCAHADVVLQAVEGPDSALVTSFAEPYQGVDPRAPSELIDHAEAWAGLNGCRGLARDLRANPRRFRFVPAGRILSLAQAMTQKHGPRGFRLVYLWFEEPGRAAGCHRKEIDRLRMRIGGEVNCVTLTWQELYQDLQRLGGEHGRYLDYLGARYFSDP